MDRDYANQEHNEDTTYFFGTEVEHTSAYGCKTLFVVGLQDPEEIIEIAQSKQCTAIYFGANHSFSIKSKNDQAWIAWEDMIREVLNHADKFWCTLDFDVACAEAFHESGLSEHNNFIAVISVKLPYSQLFNYNTVLKIDDTDFDHSTPGVWSHRLHDLMDIDKFTSWADYKDDTTI